MSDFHGVDKDRTTSNSQLPTPKASLFEASPLGVGSWWLGVVVLTGALAASLSPSTPLGAGLQAEAQNPTRTAHQIWHALPATLLISQDPVKDDARPEPRIRFVILKQHTPDREERIRNFFMSTGRAISQKIDGDPTSKPDSDDARFQINFGLLHAGI